MKRNQLEGYSPPLSTTGQDQTHPNSGLADNFEISYVPVSEEAFNFENRVQVDDDEGNNSIHYIPAINQQQESTSPYLSSSRDDFFSSSNNNSNDNTNMNESNTDQENNNVFVTQGGFSSSSNIVQESNKTRFRRQPKKSTTGQDQDNFSKQSHLFFVPSNGNSPQTHSSHQGYSSGYNVPEFLPMHEMNQVPNLSHHATLGNPSAFNNVPSMDVPVYQKNDSPSTHLHSYHPQQHSNYTFNSQNNAYFASSGSSNLFNPELPNSQFSSERKEFKPQNTTPSKGKKGACLTFLVLVALFLIIAGIAYGIVMYSGLLSRTDSSFASSFSFQQSQEQRRNLDNDDHNTLHRVLDDHVSQFMKENEESVEVETNQEPDQSTETQQEQSAASDTTTVVEDSTKDSTTDTSQQQSNTETLKQETKDEYNFYDPYKKEEKPEQKPTATTSTTAQKQVSPKKPQKKPQPQKKNVEKKKLALPQEIYDRVYSSKKRSRSNEAKFNFMDDKIEKYLDSLSKKQYNRLSKEERAVIQQYVALRERESMQKTSSHKYKKKGIKKKRTKVNPYEFDYSSNPVREDEMEVTSDPTLPLKTTKDKRGRIHHVDPFGENEHENDEMYDEDVKSYMRNPNYQNYLDNDRD
ncbi:hypothetical protein C9374_012469 [Naegleria lovaniensis]|uniref:Uncharacterized protein n=1 Tax=Naegleria lovaniensis TaxID=51637 RepID=A0AA88H2U7_NAELO|nr:uncharacterized protein C9374_012469 [Naegleria lovaniensis]KAG2392217.1 hypothetical protein C9374_012469 [Naegleria lovaniensis]